MTGPLYDQAEILHMKAVKELIWLDYSLLLFAVIYSAVYSLVNVIWNKRNRRRDLGLGAAWGGGLTVGLLCFFSIFAFTDFNSFFIKFHKIFFPEGNWQFPPGDHMITVFPDGFWSNVTTLVGLVTLVMAIIVLSVGLVLLHIKKGKPAPIQARIK